MNVTKNIFKKNNVKYFKEHTFFFKVNYAYLQVGNLLNKLYVCFM